MLALTNVQDWKPKKPGRWPLCVLCMVWGLSTALTLILSINIIICSIGNSFYFLLIVLTLPHQAEVPKVLKRCVSSRGCQLFLPSIRPAFTTWLKSSSPQIWNATGHSAITQGKTNPFIYIYKYTNIYIYEVTFTFIMDEDWFSIIIQSHWRRLFHINH